MNIKEFDGENDCVICYVFNNTTQYFQLLDLLSELCNNLFKRVFELWYANEVKKQLKESLWNKCSIEMIDIETYPRTLASRFVWASNKSQLYHNNRIWKCPHRGSGHQKITKWRSFYRVRIRLIKLETQVVLLLKIRGKKNNLNVLSLYLIFCNLRLNLMKSPLEKNFVAECVAIVS